MLKQRTDCVPEFSHLQCIITYAGGYAAALLMLIITEKSHSDRSEFPMANMTRPPDSCFPSQVKLTSTFSSSI